MISYPFTDRGLRGALVALGTTSDAVYTHLLTGGYRGKRGSDCGCPAAAYVTGVVAGAVSAEVFLDRDDLAPYVRVYDSSKGWVDALGTNAMAGFLRLFDLGRRYQDLEITDASH